MEKPKYSAACEKTTCGLLTNLVIGVIDDIILEKLSRDLQSDKKASQVSPLLQFRKSLQQPVEDRVHHRFAACHKALSESAPARREGIHSMCIFNMAEGQHGLYNPHRVSLHLHIRMISWRQIFEHPQQSTHSLHCLFRHFFSYIYGLLKSKNSS